MRSGTALRLALAFALPLLAAGRLPRVHAQGRPSDGSTDETGAEPLSEAPEGDPGRGSTGSLDEPPPDQEVDTDVAEVHARFEALLCVRAPLDRSYGASFAYAPVRPLAIELRLGFREDGTVELAPAVVVHLLGRPFDGLLLRVASSLRFGEGQRAASVRLDAELGYALFTRGLVIELDLGVAVRGGDEGPKATPTFGIRGGFAY